MPSSHRRYAGWTIERIRADARLIGPATAALCELILEARPHPEQGFRACLGIVRLAGPHGAERLEAAAERAIDIGARTYGSVKSILDNNLDRRPARQRSTDGTPILPRRLDSQMGRALSEARRRGRGNDRGDAHLLPAAATPASKASQKHQHAGTPQRGDPATNLCRANLPQR